MATRRNKELREILSLRLAAQGLTGSPFGTTEAYVAGSLAVQAQDPTLSRYSIGLRTGEDDSLVRQALDSSRVLRTHAIRPTWHYVHWADLRWLLQATSPKVLRGLVSRGRQLGIDAGIYDQAVTVLERELTHGRALSRKELHPLFPSTGYSRQGEVVGHLLMLAELRGVIASGSFEHGRHTYTLLDPLISALGAGERSGNVEELVLRLVSGRGPIAEADFRRWCPLTLSEVREVLSGTDFASREVNGVRLWWQAKLVSKGMGFPMLLPTFDEVFLTHAIPRFSRPHGHPLGDQHLNPSESGGGVIIAAGEDIGIFKRKVNRSSLRISLTLASDASVRARGRAIKACEKMSSFFGMPADVVL